MDNTTYEFFIRRAWKCDRFEKGADTDTWEGLLHAKFEYEEAMGKSDEGKLKKKYEKEFAKVKAYIDKAYNNLLNRIKDLDNIGPILDPLLDMKIESRDSKTPQELFKVISRSFELMNENNL